MWSTSWRRIRTFALVEYASESYATIVHGTGVGGDLHASGAWQTTR